MQASSRTPKTSSRKPTVTISTPATPKTPSATTPITNRKMSTRAQAAAERKASMRKASMMASPRHKTSASTPADRALFSSAKTLARSSASGPKFNPRLIASIRSEDYATLFKKNSEANAKVGEARSQMFQMASKMTDSLAHKIGERNKAATELETKMDTLAKTMEAERKKLLAMLQDEQ